MAKQQTIAVELTSIAPIGVGKAYQANWGENSQAIVVEGEIVEIMIRLKDKAKISLSIDENGNIILTNYDVGFDTFLGRSLRLNNVRKWGEE